MNLEKKNYSACRNSLSMATNSLVYSLCYSKEKLQALVHKMAALHSIHADKGVAKWMALVVAIAISLPTYSQSPHALIFYGTLTQQQLKSVAISSNDSATINREINRYIAKLWTKGYAAAGVDSIQRDSASTSIFIYKGIRVKRVRINLQVPDGNYQLPTKVMERNLSRISLLNTTNTLLSKMENQGYPFSSLQFDSVSIKQNRLSGSLKLIPGTFVVFDTLIIKGKYRVNRNYLNYLLGVEKGMPYSEKKIGQIGSSISQLGYLTSIRPAEAEFIPGKARVYVYLKQKKANLISALIGLAGKETGGGITFRGNATLKLVNTFNIGEQIQLLWTKLETNEQRLEAGATLPWLGLGGFGSNGSLSIYRKDTTTLVVNPKIGLMWSGTSGHRLSAWFELRKVASSGSTTLAGYGNSNATLYGLGYGYYHLEENLFPTSEISISSGVAIGSRVADYAIPTGETIPQTSTAYSLNAKVGVYHSIAGKLGLYCAYHGGAIGAFGANGYNQLFYNELLRVGGYTTLRGFDEDFFWVSSFHVATAEARYYFERESYGFLFIDAGYLERSWINGFSTFKPTGIGIGTQLEVSGGLFQLAYALGSINGATPQFKDAKVHFGFTAMF